jgi:carboxypeptidase C (cathepsin A)
MKPSTFTAMNRARTAVVALVLVMTAPLWAQPSADAAEGEQSRPAHRFERSGEAQIGGERLRYRTLVEETFVTNDAGQRTASLVSTTYLREDAGDTLRPVVFVFNGGPGSAGLWLQMGLVGPRRVDFDDDVHPPTAPPFRLADNAESILDVVDVVIFDPPGTGYSRVLAAGKPEEFFGTAQDAKVAVNFIREWLQRHGRWNSPRFLLGESYGTIRAAVVAKLAVGGPFGSGSMDALTLNGVILLGQAMDGGNGEASFATDLPSFAATAWYHSKVDRADRTLEQHVSEASEFAAGEYIQALFAGTRLGVEQKQKLAERIAALTGLPASMVMKNNLRVSADTFSNSLLADQDKQVGKYDARFVLPLAASGNDPVADDPAMGQYVPAFVAALNMHLREEVGVDIDEPYLAIEFHKVNGPWNYGSGPGVHVPLNHSEDLATAMRRNPALQLFVGTGYYDLVTTVGAAEYTVAHADFPADRVTMRNYASGHMPYLGTESREALARDLRQFITGASQP